MDEKFALDLEDLDKITGGDFDEGELDSGDIALLRSFIIIYKEQGYSKKEVLATWKGNGASNETLTYIDTHWDEIHR